MTMRSSHVILADRAQRYWELTRLVADARHVMAPLHDELVQAICADGEPICVEGLPTLRVVERRAGRLWDLKALAANEPREFQRLVELGCLTVVGRVEQAQMNAGNLSGIHRKYGWETRTQLLAFDRSR